MFDCVRFSGYKSFAQDETIDISNIEVLNLFIGKNNSGKSSALEMISAACDSEKQLALASKPVTLKTGYLIDEASIKRAFLRNGYLDYGAVASAKNFVGEYFWIEPRARSWSSSGSVLALDYDGRLNANLQTKGVSWEEYFRQLPKREYHFLKISAERNIFPEQASENNLQPNGSGATNLIRKIVNHNFYDESLIEKKLLLALNQIMGSDAQFESIRVQEVGAFKQDSIPKWEVFLQEAGSRRVPLSQSGSGLKTIILVLLNLLVLPEIGQGDAEYVYGFEELENNLHPALQRRLFEFVYQYATETHRPVFLTTHSHVAINMFYGKDGTSLYHVTKDGNGSAIKRIENYVDKAEILDDLDVKASDLLQSNGVIWVEGPSDRVYVKRWLEVFGGTDICEGTDYQFAYYGGRLLSHYSAEEECDGLINILLINRNSAILIDSDKRARNSSINATKKRVQNEFEKKGLLCWIAKGKEIENYLSVSAINRAFSSNLTKQCKQFELFPEYVSDVCPRFTSKKVPFSNMVKDHIDDENILDLETQVRKLYQKIKLWNK